MNKTRLSLSGVDSPREKGWFVSANNEHRLSVGIQLPEVERAVPWHEYSAMARAADSSTFDSIWVGDHLLYRGDGRPERGPFEAWTLLAALSSITSRVRLGPLVACVGFHPPAVIAKMAATVSEISNGRLILGLGAGWNEPEFEAFDIPFDHRASRFEEALTIISQLVAGERCTYTGRFHDVRDAVLLPEPTREIPIMIGSNGDRVLSFALRTASMWNTWFDWFENSPSGFARLNTHVSSLISASGRSPSEVRRSACLLVKVDPMSSERPDPHEGQAVKLAEINTVLREMRDAGANEVIIVADPITERSIHVIGDILDV